MNAWQSGYHDAEAEYREMNEQILKEVPLTSQAEIRPAIIVIPQEYLFLQQVPPSSLAYQRSVFLNHQYRLWKEEMISLWTKL